MRVNQKQLSEIFGVSTRTIRDWDASGCPSFTNSKTKEYEPAEVIRWRIDKAIAEDSPTVADDEEVKQALRVQAIAKSKTASAAAESAYIDLALKKGDVVLRVEVEEIVSDVLSEVIQALDVIPLRYAQQVLGCKTENEVKEILQTGVYEARSNISKISININLANANALKKEEQEEHGEDVQE